MPNINYCQFLKGEDFLLFSASHQSFKMLRRGEKSEEALHICLCQHEIAQICNRSVNSNFIVINLKTSVLSVSEKPSTDQTTVLLGLSSV